MGLDTAQGASPRRSKADEVYELVRIRIVRTELAPDEPFVEREIIDATGYGATPVREALDRLDRDGFVVTIPRRGYRVAPLTTKTLDDFMQVWSVILPLVIKTAMKRMSPEQALRMDRSFEAHQAQLERGAEDPLFFLGSRRERYLLLAEAADNPSLTRVFERLVNESERIFWVAHASDPKIVRRLEFDPSLRGRDEEGLIRELEKRLEESHALARKILQEREARDSSDS